MLDFEIISKIGTDMESPIRILLVEDSKTQALQLIQAAEQMPGVTIESCGCAADIASHAFDILVIDLTLPDSSIDESIKLIARYSVAHAVIVYTAMADEKTVDECRRAGACEFLHKNLASAIQYTIRQAIDFQRERNLAGAYKRFHSVADKF